MRMKIGGLAALLSIGLLASGCAAGMGTVAGNVVGGTGWVAMKTGKLAWKGGSFAAKTTGRTVVGAARGVHEEFSGKGSSGSGQTAKADAPAGASQGQGATLSD